MVALITIGFILIIFTIFGVGILVGVELVRRYADPVLFFKNNIYDDDDGFV